MIKNKRNLKTAVFNFFVACLCSFSLYINYVNDNGSISIIISLLLVIANLVCSVCNLFMYLTDK